MLFNHHVFTVQENTNKKTLYQVFKHNKNFLNFIGTGMLPAYYVCAVPMGPGEGVGSLRTGISPL